MKTGWLPGLQIVLPLRGPVFDPNQI